jgi:very-short-patch-repair endonuclease
MRESAKKEFARQLRANMTDAEQQLWRYLRQRQLADCRFRRQHPVGPFIADFACIEKHLIIEIDGGQHNPVADAGRDVWFERHGWRVLRYWNDDVLGRTADVLADILRVIESPHPNLPPQAGEGDDE